MHSEEAYILYLAAILIEEPENLDIDPDHEKVPLDKSEGSCSSLSPKKYHTSSSRRLSGRLGRDRASPSLNSVSSLSSLGSSSTLEPSQLPRSSNTSQPQGQPHQETHAHHIISQVQEWLRAEKAKRAKSKARKHGGLKAKISHAAGVGKEQTHSKTSEPHDGQISTVASDLSDEGMDLDKLEHILAKTMSLDGVGLESLTENKDGSYFPRRVSRSKPVRQASKKLLRKRSTVATSDTEYQEPDIDVPSAEVVLDNSKTLGYSGGVVASSEFDLTKSNTRSSKEKDAWLQFKFEIVRLTHTLRLKGWRRLPLANSGDIDVERLSGALTNAVYVVSPPSILPPTPSEHQDSTASALPKKPPP